MVAGHLCDFFEILARWRWVWCGVSSQFDETKNYCLACNAKSKSGRAKILNATFLTAKRAVWGSQSGGHGLNHLLENYTRNVTNFWPNFGGFLLGWRGLPVYPIRINIGTNI